MKVASSLDGYLDDLGQAPRLFSSPEDRIQIDALRAEADAILLGAETFRKDNPRLLLPQELHAVRVARGQAPEPTKIVLTRSARLSKDAAFFKQGDGEKLVFCPAAKAKALSTELGVTATVLPFEGESLAPEILLATIFQRGIRRLLLEGGATLISQFSEAGLIDGFRFAVSPEFLGENQAPRIPQTAFPKDCKITWVQSFGGTLVVEGNPLKD